MTLSRRNFLRRAGGAAFAPSLVGLAACVDDGMTDPALRPQRAVTLGSGGYGPLSVSPDCPELLIPDGFKCVKLSETLLPSQGNPNFIVPQAFDGMAAFRLPRGRIRLVRNHEIRDPVGVASPFGPNPYDTNAGGGTTTLEVEIQRSGNEVTGVRVIAEWPSITGTHVNCAGGPTPWGSWITCEETTEGPTQGRNKPHGYCFDVPHLANRPVNPVPLKAMGRFVHEAVAVDPATGIIYETEDRSFTVGSNSSVGSGFYRFIPDHAGLPHEGGKLQVLKVDDADNYNTTTGQTPGQVLTCSWVDIDDPDPAEAETDPSAVFREGLSKGAAIFQRLEGCWYGDASIFFNATSGGEARAGQVFQYRPTGADTGELILVFESPDSVVLDSPDNITVSQRGGIVLCEDGGGEQFLRGLTPTGDIFDFVQTNGPLPEFCGACFAPVEGDVLFFNIQGSTSSVGAEHGYTFAMWGPWNLGCL